jgi:hypothetical protein
MSPLHRLIAVATLALLTGCASAPRSDLAQARQGAPAWAPGPDYAPGQGAPSQLAQTRTDDGRPY